MNHQSAVVAEPAPPQVVQSDLTGALQRQGVTEKSWTSGSETLTGDSPSECLVDNCLSPPATNGSNDDAAANTPNFSRLEVRQVRQTITDDDDGRALITRWLINELAPLLGLDPNRIEIRVNSEAESRINARGARGLMEGGKIYLHPKHYQPQANEGRYLIAHEAAHLAQLQNAGETNHAEAEREAAAVANAFVHRRVFQRPRRHLALTIAAADTDAPVTEEKPPPPLAESVVTARDREIRAIKSLLSGLWISDGDVFKVMRILDTMDYFVRKAVVAALGETKRYELADNINPPHIYAHRMSVLACYDALSPDQFDAVDLKVLRALPGTGLTTEETEAAVYTLKNLSDSQRRELLRSENGPAIARIISSPQPSATESQQLKEAREKAAKGEAELAATRKKILAHKDDSDAKSLIDQVKELLSVRRVGNRNHRPGGQDAIQALNLLATVHNDKPRLAYVGERLEEDGLVDDLLQLLPAASYFDTPEHADTLIQIVNSRLPTKNAELIEDLLSYGLFDWAIRDYEALFAYRLIRLLPLTDQYRFRQRDAGKWYIRLLENLPNDPETSKPYPGLEIRKAESKEEIKKLKEDGITVDENELLFNASQVYEKKLADKGASQTLQDLIDAFREAEKGIFRDEEAKDLFRQLVALGGSSLEVGKEHPGDQVLREAVIHELDRLGYIEELFSQTPDSFLFSQENRISTVKIMLARDPARVQAHARELVSRGFTDWMVNDGEAYLAYMCIKALPQDERNGFIKANAEEWDRIQGEMSESMRQARDTNLYVGDKAGVDRASVLAQLADEKNWKPENVTILDSLLRMAIAMTEHKFAYERSREFNAKGVPALATLVEKYRLWDPSQGRDEYKADVLQGTKWYEEGIFASLRSFWGGLVTLWNMDILFIDGKIGAKVDLNDVQSYMGGDIMGARLADPAKRGSRQSPAAGPDTNKLTLLVDPNWIDGEGKSAEVILPQLLIDSANIQTGSTTVQASEIDLRNLHIRAAYDAQNKGQPTQAHVTLDSLVVNDLLFASPASMLTITRLMVMALRLAAGTVDTTTGAPPAERKGRYIPFPLLVLMMLPWLAQLAVTSLMAAGIKRLSKIGDQGLDPKSRFAPDIAERVKAIDFSFSSLSAEGVTTSGGQQVAHAEVRDFALRVGLNKATRLRAELASIAQRKAALEGKPDAAETLAKLEARRAELEGQRKEIEKQEQEYLQIQRKIHAGDLDPGQQIALQKRLDELNFEDKGSSFLDIGSVEASGIAGTVTSKEPIRLANIHGEGSSSAMMGFLSAPTVTSDELSRRAKAGERPSPVISTETEGSFMLELGDVHTGRLEVGGGVRTPEDIDRKLEELEKLGDRPELKPLIESLQLLRVKAVRYQAMVAHGVSALSNDQLDEFRALRRALTADAALIVESIDLTRARLDIDLASGRVGLGADRARIAGLQLPQNGIEVEEIVATGIRAGALPANGLLDWSEWKKNLRDADGKLDSLEIKNARSKYHGLIFEKATLTGAYAKVKDRGNLVEAGLQQLNVQGLGLVPRLGLMSQRLAGLREKARVADAKDKPAIEEEIDKLATKLAELQALADRRLIAYMSLDRAKTPSEIAIAKEEVAEVDGTIAYDLAQYGVAEMQLDEFGVKVGGAGDLISDVLGGGLDPLSILERGGVTITGTGPNDRLFKRLSLHHAQTASHMPEEGFEANASAIEIGETRLNVSARKEGDGLLIDVPKFDIDSLTLSQFLLTSSDGDEGFQVWSRGSSAFEMLTFKGSVRLESRVPKSRELSDYRLASVHVEEFKLDKLLGNGLGFAHFARKIEVDIKSGSINGITGSGIDVKFPEDKDASPVITGKLGIDSIDKLVIGKAMVGAWTAGGRIDARTISVEMLEDGGIKAGIGDLDLTSFSVRGPDGWVRLSLADFGGKFTYRDGALAIEEAHLGSLRVSGVHWKVGETGYVESKKNTTLTGLSVKGRVETRLEPVKGEPGKTERKLSHIVIDRLHIGKVESEELIYHDANNHVVFREADPTFEKQMVGFKPLFIQNLDVWGLDWTPESKVTKGTVKVETYETSAHYEGLKSGLKAGIALKGKGMSAEMVGKDAFTVDVGKIEKTGGQIHTKNFDSKFTTGAIVGKVAIGPDYVEVQNVEIDQTQLALMRYTDLPKVLMMSSVSVKRITLGKVRQNYTTDPADKEVQIPTTLDLSDLNLYDIKAREFDYEGESRGTEGEGADLKETVSKQHVTGDMATISHLQVSKLHHDAITSQTTLSAKIDTKPDAKKGTQPFRIQGLSAQLVDIIGTAETRKKLISDVVGGPLTAEDIKFQTVVLGTAPGPDGKPVDVTRTAIDGSFTLTALGLLNPDLTLTDEKGKTTSITGVGKAIEIKGIKPRFFPNGTIALPIDQVIGKRLQITKGGMTVTLPALEIETIAMGLKGMGTEQGIDMLATKIGSIKFEGLRIRIVETRKPELTPKEYDEKVKEFEEKRKAEKTDPSGSFIAEPLSGLSGSADGEYSWDIPLPWTDRVIPWEDPDITPAIENGVLMFGGMTNYAVQLHTEEVERDGVTREEDKIALGNLVTMKTLLDFKRKMPGFYGDEGKYNYGKINIREMIEGFANEEAARPERTFEPPAALKNLYGFTGSFMLGDGRMGRDKDNDKKLGEGDTWIELKRNKADQNTIKMLESNIGERINLVASEFFFSGAGFTAGKTQDGKVRIGRTEGITLTQIEIKVEGLADFTMTITLAIKKGMIENVTIGDIKFADATELSKLTAPTVTAVNPKGTPK